MRGFLGKHHTEETKKKLSEIGKQIGNKPEEKKRRSERAKKLGYRRWIKGGKTTEETKGKIAKTLKKLWKSKEYRKKMSESAKKYNETKKGKIQARRKVKLMAKKRWEGHIKVNKHYSYPYTYHTYKEKYPNGATEKKRFTNMRYKARKRNTLGSHTFEEWIKLKEFYGNMCLCCKRIEPEIVLSEDHIIPLDKGGSDFIENIQPLCVSCNSIKHTKTTDYRILLKEGGERVNLYPN